VFKTQLATYEGGKLGLNQLYQKKYLCFKKGLFKKNVDILGCFFVENF